MGETSCLIMFYVQNTRHTIKYIIVWQIASMFFYKNGTAEHIELVGISPFYQIHF